MTKADLVSEIREKIIREDLIEYNIENQEIALIINTFFEIIKEYTGKGESIELRGFGTFKHKVRAEKIARNPRTNETVKMKKHAIPYFKPGSEFKEIMKNLKV